MSLLDEPQVLVAQLVEREHALDELEAAFERAFAGQGCLAVVTAEAGGGKTALIERFCAAKAGSARVLRGACDALFTPRPLGPIHDVAVEVGSALTDLLLREATPYRVAALMSEEFRGRQPTVLVIEDLHWADEATLDVLTLLARRIAMARVLIVLSYRDEAVDSTHPLRLMLGELAPGLAVARVRLAPLTLDGVARLAEPYGVDAEGLRRVTGGNPFFVTEVLASGEQELPTTVRDAVLARSARLTPEARSVLEAVAIATPHADLRLVEAVSGEIDGRLDECIRSGMLVSENDTVAFRHELARLALEESVSPARRLSLHRRALETLVSQNLGDRGLARISHHADAAGDREAVLRFAPAAGAHASAVGAHREAAEQYARALHYSDGLPPSEVVKLHELYSQECYLTDQADEAIDALRRAVECYREIGDHLKEGETIARLASILWCPGRGEEARRTARQSVELLEQFSPGRELALAHVSLAFVQVQIPDDESAWRSARRALELAERLDDPDVYCKALYRVGRQELREDSNRGLATIERAVALARERGLEELVAEAHLARAQIAIAARRPDDARVTLEEGLTYCQRTGNELIELYLLADRALLEFHEGRWSDAAETATRVIRRRAVSTLPRTLALSVLARVRARRGDPDVLPLLAEARALAESTNELHRLAPVAVAGAEAAWLRGDPASAREATADALTLAVSVGAGDEIACLQVWRKRAGVEEPPEELAAGPYALELAGDPVAAVGAWADLGRPYEAALALADVGTEAALREALEALAELGAPAAAAIVTRRLRAIGARDIPRGPRPATRQNSAGLTAREVEILGLVVEGLRNREIAQRLFLSPRTVEKHVSAIMRKLGARSRGEAVAEAARLSLLQDA
jgi:DNA-binding CsgD family transcriptional regulator/tetratricopeptide (TPR) repeat protein